MDFFLARQPIFDSDQECVAYEILARTGPENFFPGGDAETQDLASREVLAGSSLLFGLEELTSGKTAFFNATRAVLLGGELKLLPTENVVIELLESIEPDEEVVAAVRELRELGYTLALDDFVYDPKFDALIELIDIIKVDFRLSSREVRGKMPKILGRPGLKFLAEKVETAEEMEEAENAGYELFQGYFFAVPVMMQAQKVPGSKTQYLRVMSEVSKPEFDLEAVLQIVSQDPSLTYNLLRQVNSISYGFNREIESLREAMVLLGEEEVRKTLALLAMFEIGSDRPSQLLIHAVTRARFCESVAIRTVLASRCADTFLLGMFSLLDSMVGRPMDEILEKLPLSEDIKMALLGHENPVRKILDLACAYERGDWESLESLHGQIGIDEAELPTLYVAAVAWTEENFLAIPDESGEEIASAR